MSEMTMPNTGLGGLRATRTLQPIERDLYSDGVRIGAVRSKSDGFDALDAGDRPLGRFNTEQAAASEIILRRQKAEVA